jgi:hypothetical protein
VNCAEIRVEHQVGSGRRGPLRELKRPCQPGDFDGRHRTRRPEVGRHRQDVQDGVASEVHVERRERASRLDHHRDALAVAAIRPDEGDRALEAPGRGREQRIVQIRKRSCEVRLCTHCVAGGQVGGRCTEQSDRSLLRVDRQFGGACEQRS